LPNIALAQLNLLVGDIEGNAQLVVDCAQRLRGKADIVVFPELTLTGYPPVSASRSPSVRTSGSIHRCSAASRPAPRWC
jgi:NAD+ synthase (glutamine-hydrolysing)